MTRTVEELEALLSAMTRDRDKEYEAKEAAESRLNWQPRETAPRDGKKYVAFTANFENGVRFNECVQDARWSGKTPTDPAGHHQSRNGQMVLGWMPMPEPMPL